MRKLGGDIVETYPSCALGVMVWCGVVRCGVGNV